MEEKVILNSPAQPIASSAVSSEEIVKKLRVSITSLVGAHMSEDGSKVDYKGMGSSPQFKTYTETAELLAIIDPATFSQDKRKAFFINIYNSLTVHAMVYQAGLRGSLPKAPKDVAGFWSIHCYTIGGQVYSLDQIEHGLLRANKGHPAAGKEEFPPSDPRRPVALHTLDPRIHFALNCGARSCPPIRIYTEDKIDSQLEVAARSFLGQEVVVRGGEPCTVETSKLLQWYGGDFGPDPRGVLGWVAGVLGAGDAVGDQLQKALKGEVELTFRDYNWAANSED